MKNNYIVACSVLLVAGVMLLNPLPVVATETVEQELIAIRSELKDLHLMVEEQNKMLHDFYEYVDQDGLITAWKRERAEDERLMLKPVAEVTDRILTSHSSANPVSPEIAVITDEGDIRIYDFAGQILQTLTRTGEVVTTVSYSQDGHMLLAGTKSGTLLVWNSTSQSWSDVAEQAEVSIGRVDWLDTTNKVVWGNYVDYYGKDGKPINRDKPTGWVLDRSTGKSVWSYQSFVRNDFQTLSVSPDGKRLAVLEIPDHPRGTFMLDEATGEIKATLLNTDHGRSPLSVCIAPDGKTVAVGYAPYDIILWNSENEALLKILTGHNNWVVSLAFSPDGRYLISGSGDSSARVWSVESGEEIGRIRFPGRSTYVKSVGFSPDGKKIYALAEGGMLKIASFPRVNDPINGGEE